MGHAPRVLSGWVPTPEDPSEWNQNQREMMFALMEAEADLCDGCGGFLSFTSKQDHGISVGRIECQHCKAIHDQQEQWSKEYEEAKNVANAPVWEPSAQKIRTRPVPLSPEEKAEAEVQGIYGKAREED